MASLPVKSTVLGSYFFVSDSMEILDYEQMIILMTLRMMIMTL